MRQLFALCLITTTLIMPLAAAENSAPTSSVASCKEVISESDFYARGGKIGRKSGPPTPLPGTCLNKMSGRHTATVFATIDASGNVIAAEVKFATNECWGQRLIEWALKLKYPSLTVGEPGVCVRVALEAEINVSP